MSILQEGWEGDNMDVRITHCYGLDQHKVVLMFSLQSSCHHQHWINWVSMAIHFSGVILFVPVKNKLIAEVDFQLLLLYLRVLISTFWCISLSPKLLMALCLMMQLGHKSRIPLNLKYHAIGITVQDPTWISVNSTTVHLTRITG